MKIVNAKGFLCPKPLIMTKKVLKEASLNERFVVLIDNEVSMQNVTRLLKDNNAKTEVSEKDGVYKITVTKLEKSISMSVVEEYCEVPEPKKGKHVYVFKINGVGSDELGQMLTEGFLDTIKEVDPLPDKIICYYEGIFLTLDDSPFLGKLQELEELGIQILICGNCVNFYKVKDRVKVGIVSNAYDILKAFTDASHLIYP
ncbi:MAG: sulfurtransferase-like selenium metabolism protein YedF [Candidatus Cloacimonetes bacterium]|nr:sulfurtransferase-like selenium metabolism protein YedF [Candidatus Cloacimonadota bacterium]